MTIESQTAGKSQKSDLMNVKSQESDDKNKKERTQTDQEADDGTWDNEKK
jgi:hypothetical protein